MTTATAILTPPNGQLDLPALEGAGYSTKQIHDVQVLKRLQDDLGLDNTAFTKGASIDSTTWSRVYRGKYNGRVDNVLVEMKRHAKQLRQQTDINAQRASRNLNEREFIPFNEYDALRAAVNSTLASSDRGEEDKLVLYVAPSGGGKTRVGKQLATCEGFNAIMITGRPSWATAYYPALMAIAKALGVGDGNRSASQAETAVLDKMKESKGVLIVNEVELLCRQVRHLFRSILNETPWSVVLLLTPQGYRYLTQRPSSDSAQLLRRCEAIITATLITPEQVQKFLQQHWQLTDALRVASIDIAQDANAFGGFDFVVRVIELVAEALHGTGDTPSRELVLKKIAASRRAVPLVQSTRTAA